MLSRRRFMFLLGGATTGLWLASRLVRLERNFMLSVAGTCSFCGKDRRDVRALVGTAGHATRICDECVALCCEIIGEDLGFQSPRDVHAYEPPRFDDDQFHDRVGEILQRYDALRNDALLDDLRRSLESHRSAGYEQFQCSFCGATRADVARLISGPRVFICDSCIGDSTAVVAHVLRALSRPAPGVILRMSPRV